MNKFMVQNEFGAWVVDIFAMWLDTHALGDMDDPSPIHNNPPIDIFLIGVNHD